MGQSRLTGDTCTKGLARSEHPALWVSGDHTSNAGLGHSFGSWNWGLSRTGPETEAIDKEKCKDLIQCQKLWGHNKAQNISLHEP